MAKLQRLNSRQMAQFAARGFLMFEGVVPEEINKRFLADIGHTSPSKIGSIAKHYARVMNSSAVMPKSSAHLV